MSFMLSDDYTDCRKIAYYAECRYAECHGDLPGPNVKFFTSVI